MERSFDAEAFRAATNVSRETIVRLETYAEALRGRQTKLNLVGPGTLDQIWHRHFLDSAQLLAMAPPQDFEGAQSWVDVGSGAGFPGMVLAIMGAAPMHLIEANSNKCAFLAEVARATDTKVHIHDRRAEDVTAEEIGPGGPDVITVRAVSALPKLLKSIRRLLAPRTTLLMLAGQDVERPLTIARKSWNMTVEKLPSVTHPASNILRIQGLQSNGPNTNRISAAPRG